MRERESEAGLGGGKWWPNNVIGGKALRCHGEWYVELGESLKSV